MSLEGFQCLSFQPVPFGELVAEELLLELFVVHEQRGVDIALESFELLLLLTICLQARDRVRKRDSVGEVGLHPQHGAENQSGIVSNVYIYFFQLWLDRPIKLLSGVISWLSQARQLHSVEFGAAMVWWILCVDSFVVILL